MADAGGRDLDQDLAGAGLGTGTSSITSGLPNSRTTAAFMVVGMMVLLARIPSLACSRATFDPRQQDRVLAACCADIMPAPLIPGLPEVCG